MYPAFSPETAGTGSSTAATLGAAQCMNGWINIQGLWRTRISLYSLGLLILVFFSELFICVSSRPDLPKLAQKATVHQETRPSFWYGLNPTSQIGLNMSCREAANPNRSLSPVASPMDQSLPLCSSLYTCFPSVMSSANIGFPFIVMLMTHNSKIKTPQTHSQPCHPSPPASKKQRHGWTATSSS